MRTKGSSSTPETERSGPDVLLDVEFEAGVLFLVVANRGERAALAVSLRFERPFKGLSGSQEMTRLPLLRKIEFLAPGREIRTLLDSSAAYFARREPAKLTVEIRYRDEDGGRHERRIVHDLRIYRDIAYLPD